MAVSLCVVSETGERRLENEGREEGKQHYISIGDNTRITHTY